MKKYIKIFLLLIAVSIFASFAACNQGKGSNGKDYNVDEEKYDLKGRTIIMGDIYNISEEQQKLSFEPINKKYNCKIEYKKIENNYYYNNLYADLKAGTLDCHILFVNQNLPVINMVKENLIVPLDDYIDFNEEKFNLPVNKMFMWNGKHYGVDARTIQNISSSIMLYDIGMLEQSGLEDLFDLQEKGQWTWDIFLEYTKKLTSDKDGNGIPDIWGCVVPYHLDFFKNLVYSNNGKFAAESENGNFTSTINSKEVLTSFNYFKDLVNVHKSILVLGTSGNSYDIAKQVMKERRGAIYAYNLNPLTEEKERLGMVYYPKGPDADKYIAAYNTYSFYAIPSYVSNPEEVSAIFKEFFREDLYSSFIDYYRKRYNEHDFSIIKYGLDNPEFYHYSSVPMFYRYYYMIINNIINNYFITENEFIEAIEDANVKAQAVLDEF